MDGLTVKRCALDFCLLTNQLTNQLLKFIKLVAPPCRKNESLSKHRADTFTISLIVYRYSQTMLYTPFIRRIWKWYSVILSGDQCEWHTIFVFFMHFWLFHFWACQIPGYPILDDIEFRWLSNGEDIELLYWIISFLPNSCCWLCLWEFDSSERNCEGLRKLWILRSWSFDIESKMIVGTSFSSYRLTSNKALCEDRLAEKSHLHQWCKWREILMITALRNIDQCTGKKNL